MIELYKKSITDKNKKRNKSKKSDSSDNLNNSYPIISIYRILKGIYRLSKSWLRCIKNQQPPKQKKKQIEEIRLSFTNPNGDIEIPQKKSAKANKLFT